MDVAGVSPVDVEMVVRAAHGWWELGPREDQTSFRSFRPRCPPAPAHGSAQPLPPARP